ncbi:FliH/SctL family protein [Paenibacillus swuensis]|uniref:FliH/SctL family protein n=1 Tax=Paenibacillus swuensis TaxID=1178515 RepID=UPI001E5E53B3|nr:FliH/SctL family protein [Paenibacillus swuensis]
MIKLTQYVSLDHIKYVEAPEIVYAPAVYDYEEGSEEEVQHHARQEELSRAKAQLMHEAETYAQEQIHAAEQEATARKQRAEEEIDLWWQERRLQDEIQVNEAKGAGFLDGYQEGLTSAEANMKEQYQQMLVEASGILEQAHSMKQLIIQEAEPFLIELSTSIAAKILDRQLTVEREWTVDIVKSILSRRREQGLITLCVSPTRFGYIQGFREELVLHMDSQAELQILPDASVSDHGCVVRSSFGSIDARIDTQLTEIKKVLLQIAKGSGEHAGHGKG